MLEYIQLSFILLYFHIFYLHKILFTKYCITIHSINFTLKYILHVVKAFCFTFSFIFDKLKRTEQNCQQKYQIHPMNTSKYSAFTV